MNLATIPAAAPALLPAAAKAASASPEETIAAWIASLRESTRQTYQRSYSTFVAWATGRKPVDPAGEAIRILASGDRRHARGLAAGIGRSISSIGR